MSFQLSDRAKELIPKARIVDVEAFTMLSTGAIGAIQLADDEGRYLTDVDLLLLKESVEGADQPIELMIARFLRDNAAEIVTEARQAVLGEFPGITDPGGDLYPALRAEACWRDFWHFLRCITYGIASRTPNFTQADGLHHMNLLYHELKVPLAAMTSGLGHLKTASLKRMPDQADRISPYFDHLIEKMSRFE
jgi:Phycobilisome protein